MFTSITATNGKRDRHIGIYQDTTTVERTLASIKDFAGEGWKVKNTIEFKDKGVYNVRPSKRNTDASTRN